MSAKHTPGPFSPRFDQLAVYENGRTPVLLLQSEYERAQRCWQSHDELVSLLRELIDIEGPQPGTAGWAEKARAAIAKATESA